MNTLHTFASKYIIDNNIKAAILLRESDKYKNEINYFKSFYGDKVSYIYNDKKSFSTYNGMSNSKIIISFYSTATIEAFGWKKKVLHCDFTFSNEYNDYKDFIMFKKDSNYISFVKTLDSLRLESNRNY